MDNNFQYASFKDRALALLIDVVILTFASLLFDGILNFFISNHYLTLSKDVIAFFDGLFVPVYFITMLYYREQTLGDMVMKFRIVSESGVKMIFLQVIAREIVGKFICFLTLGYGYFWVIADKRNQGFHDRIARTIVIYDK